MKLLEEGDRLLLMAHDPESVKWLEDLRSL
jgi:hypothetical protein